MFTQVSPMFYHNDIFSLIVSFLPEYKDLIQLRRVSHSFRKAVDIQIFKNFSTFFTILNDIPKEKRKLFINYFKTTDINNEYKQENAKPLERLRYEICLLPFTKDEEMSQIYNRLYNKEPDLFNPIQALRYLADMDVREVFKLMNFLREKFNNIAGKNKFGILLNVLICNDSKNIDIKAFNVAAEEFINNHPTETKVHNLIENARLSLDLRDPALTPEQKSKMLRGKRPGLINLTCIDLSNTDLSGINFRCARLWGVSLQGACLNNSDLSEAKIITPHPDHFKNTSFAHANLKNAHLYNTDRYISLSSPAVSCNFEHANLENALFECILVGSKFDAANLTHTTFTNTNLTKSSFEKANLTCTKFYASLLHDITFKNNILHNCKLNNSILRQCMFDNVSFEQIDFSKLITYQYNSIISPKFINTKIDGLQLIDYRRQFVDQINSLYDLNKDNGDIHAIADHCAASLINYLNRYVKVKNRDALINQSLKCPLFHCDNMGNVSDNSCQTNPGYQRLMRALWINNRPDSMEGSGYKRFKP